MFDTVLNTPLNIIDRTTSCETLTSQSHSETFLLADVHPSKQNKLDLGVLIQLMVIVCAKFIFLKDSYDNFE